MADDGKASAKEQRWIGQVLPLVELLKAERIDLDDDVATVMLALKTDAGAVHPLIKDGGSLPFFRDRALQKRPVRVDGRLAFGSVLAVRQYFMLKDGKAHSVYYWCDICAIKRLALDKAGVCECCGGPMERKEIAEP